jgi:opacity protein-like surface antigen
MRLSATCLLPLLLLAAPADAQEPPAARDAATSLARVPPGSTIRVLTVTGEVIEGTFRLGRDTLFLDTDAAPRTVALGDVRSAWYRQRETWPAARAGALIGGAAGGAWLGLLGIAFGGTAGETATLIAVGALGGGAAGGLLGAVVGSALPRWTLVHPLGAEHAGRVPRVTARDDARAGRRRLGALEGALGYGRVGGDEPTSGGPGGRLALHAEFGAEPPAGRTAAFLSVGPEIGSFDLGGTGLLRRTFPPADTLELSRRYNAFTAGGVLRGGVGTARVRGYGLLGLSYNRWSIDDRDARWINDNPDRQIVGFGQRSFEHLGYTAGAGAQATLARRTAVGLEVRQTAVGTFDMDLPGRYWTATLTAARRW